MYLSIFGYNNNTLIRKIKKQSCLFYHASLIYVNLSIVNRIFHYNCSTSMVSSYSVDPNFTKI